MSKENNKLGMGLGALLGPSNTNKGSVNKIDISKISPNKQQPRKNQKTCRYSTFSSISSLSSYKDRIIKRGSALSQL